MKNILLLIILLIVFSCQFQDNKAKQAEFEERERLLHEKELNLKEKELALKQQEINELKSNQRKDLNNLPELYEKVKSSVYLIYTLNSDGISQGSAFVISKNGIAVSNYHVFKSASEAIAINENGQKFQINELLSYSEELDYVIFRLNSTSDLPFAQIASTLPAVGEKCFAIGNPEGLTQTLSMGLVSSYREGQKIIQTNTEITHGSSGGPLFNSSGEVIGITTMGREQANLNFALNINKIPFSNYITYQEIEDKQALNESKLKSLIGSYYKCVGEQNYDCLLSYFASTMNRFFVHFNVSNEWVINQSKTYNKKFGVISMSYNVRWDTFNVNSLNNGNYQVDYVIDYQLNRINKNKASNFVLQMVAEITPDYKIISIYENIISKE